MPALTPVLPGKHARSSHRFAFPFFFFFFFFRFSSSVDSFTAVPDAKHIF
jgi:hypothetical protein